MSVDMSPYCSAHDKWLIMKLCIRSSCVGNGLKINVAKTEHLSTRENPLPMKLNGEELKNVDHFKYLGSVICKDGTIDRDLRARAALSSWRKLTGVLYDRKIPLRLKAKVYEAIIRPALTYGSECNEGNQQEEDCYNGDEDASLAGSSECHGFFCNEFMLLRSLNRKCQKMSRN